MTNPLSGMSLLWRIVLSTSVALAALFALTGWMVQSYAVRVSERSIEEEVRTSLQAYEALWSARARTVAAVSAIISSMSDVRAAFMTGDRATIRDTAGQLWSQVSEQDAVFLVLDPTGNVIASLGGHYPDLNVTPAQLRLAMDSFPRQVAGYVQRGNHLYYVVLTPVYVEASTGKALLNILLVAVDIDDKLARTLKTSTHGSDFSFTAGGKVVGTTLPLVGAADLASASAKSHNLNRIVLHGGDYLVLGTALEDTERRHVGNLYVIRSFAAPERALAELKRNVAAIWLVAIVLGFGLTYLLARRILRPVQTLDRAAGEVIRQNYDYRVPIETNDELGRLASTFNTMCESIRSARTELIRQERIATIGRFATSIVHDLRSPLAAIYGGTEMLVDTNLSAEQTHRLATNMYRAARRIQELLQELTDAGRAGRKPLEICRLADVVNAACDSVLTQQQMHCVSLTRNLPEEIEVPIERGRIERVFVNLLSNAVEAMPNGGRITIRAWQEQGSAIVGIEDNGPGLSEDAWATLFQPFASHGKRNGLGLGLALSRQTAIDHGGDLWADKKTNTGAAFYVRLPILQGAATNTAETCVESQQGTSAT